MPKILNDVEHLIFEKAEKLFGSRGYDNVDMKTLAANCDIAVGTLYNYYPNKKKLYIAVVLDSWKSTFKKLEQITFKDDTHDYIHKAIEILYDDVCKRQGIGNTMMRGSLEGDKEFSYVEEFINQGIKEVFAVIEKKSAFKEYKNIDNKLMFFVMSMIVTLAKGEPDDREENISLIFETMKVYYK
ncbi:MAG: TetR/AcrR family transcriptional regulator [Clostridium sp.]|uniref:TetR/AcrR family transcriptional regulator n=1 Tax=Clostridium sp. TaxID=1506 RepID=UPI002A906096|nr:TetR/AcrR family transcriptional regulator [Clostridium sp.]MDY5097098.1 TetR/AcrR family transcriptional regulator [Clostridium sp.]